MMGDGSSLGSDRSSVRIESLGSQLRILNPPAEPKIASIAAEFKVFADAAPKLLAQLELELLKYVTMSTI